MTDDDFSIQLVQIERMHGLAQLEHYIIGDINDRADTSQTATAQPFDADNGVKGHGGAIDVSGQVIAGGWLYVQSGYSMFGQLPGNMLLAYKVAAQDQAVNP